MTDEEYRRQESEKTRAYNEKMTAHNRESRERDNRQHEEARRAASSGQTSCFAAGTKITTQSGPRSIESLTSGEGVLAFCELTGELVQRPIRRHDAHSAVRIWEVTISGTLRPIATTTAHLFLTKRGWKRTRQLVPGEELRTGSGWSTVDAVRMTTRVEPVYNLVVDGELTFLADGIITHSFAHFRTFRTWLHRLSLGLPVIEGQRKWVQ